MVNCPVGHYCPNPEEKIICPAGKFCGHKSAEPWITCSKCKAGATQLERHNFGYIVLGVVGAFTLLALGFVSLRRHKKELFDHLYELQARQVDSIRLMHRHKKKQLQLERMRSKLEIISKRVDKLEGKKANGSVRAGEELRFDARKLFDVLDADGNGVLSYEELNIILGLNYIELKNFVRLMLEYAEKDQSSETVTRPTFVKHFLQVLEETSKLTVTPEEAAELYDEIAKKEDITKRHVREKMLYTSSLSNFLSDKQIYVLIKVRKYLPGVSKKKPLILSN
jgi:Ca2+-binding EF-hand superfamily protein